MNSFREKFIDLINSDEKVRFVHHGRGKHIQVISLGKMKSNVKPLDIQKLSDDSNSNS